MKIVLDTNCLLMSLSRRSIYYPIWNELLKGKYTLCYTNDILSEYEEILTWKMGKDVAENIIRTILDLPNTQQLQVHYHFHLIKEDPDDDKFVDCTIKANAHFIVTEDHHFDILRTIPFPKVSVIDIDNFCRLLSEN